MLVPLLPLVTAVLLVDDVAVALRTVVVCLSFWVIVPRISLEPALLTDVLVGVAAVVRPADVLRDDVLETVAALLDDEDEAMLPLPTELLVPNPPLVDTLLVNTLSDPVRPL